MNKIRCLVIHAMDPLGNKIGGIQTFIKNFSKYAPDDFELYFVGVSSDKKERPVGKWQIINVCKKKVNFLPILYVKDENVKTKIPLSIKFALALFLHKKQIDFSDKILAYHRIEPCISLANVLCKKILFIHGNMIDLYNPYTEVKWAKFPWLYFQMEKYLIHRFCKIFVVREDGVEFYRKRYTFMADRFSFLSTWVDEECFFPFKNEDKTVHKEMFIKEKGFPINSKLILFVGRLEGQKDPLLLIDTFRYVNKRMPETLLLIVGKGSLSDKMETMIKEYSLDKNVQFLGVLPQPKVAYFMRMSDIFLLTSAFEGMPMSVLEALCSGLPVVTTDVGEVKKIVRDRFSGMICSVRDPITLGNAVLAVLKNRNNIYSIDNCRLSIQKYIAKSVLHKLYQYYYTLV